MRLKCNMATQLDSRRHVFRPDLADISLKGRVEAARYVDGRPMQVCVPVLDLLAKPDAGALASQVLYGEVFDVFDVSDGLAWGQNRTDGYVGYVIESGLSAVCEANRTITSKLTHVYPEPNFKTSPTSQLTYMSRVLVDGEAGEFYSVADGFISKRHFDHKPTSFVEEATRFVGIPYLWGGRSMLGLDCSALVQLALMAVGVSCPRDSDMQLAELGAEVDDSYQSGDLLFWKGHVGIMFDDTTLLHANVNHMAVAFEPIVEAIARIKKTDGPVLAQKRLSI